MMKHRANRIVAVVAALILVRVLMNLVIDPLHGTRQELARALAGVPPNAPLNDMGVTDFERLSRDIQAAPLLWQGLVAPPPPPPPPPPKMPSAPDLAEILNGVQVGKEQIGTTKIKVFTPEDKRGVWLEIGDLVKGCTLISFTREEAVFTYVWEEGGQTLEIALPRY